MTRSETFLGNKNAKALPVFLRGADYANRSPGPVDHVGGGFLAFRASGPLMTPWQAAKQVALCRRAPHRGGRRENTTKAPAGGWAFATPPCMTWRKERAAARS